jgi:hypothetical protein
MPWQECVNAFNHKKLGIIYQEMEASQIKPILLRWKRAVKGYGTGFQQVHGFMGVKTETIERLDGQIEFSGQITEKAVVAFYPDTFNVAYAVIPKCERNMNILAASMNDKDLPWTIETPEVIAEVKEINALLYPKKAEIHIPLPEIKETDLEKPIEIKPVVKKEPEPKVVKGKKVKEPKKESSDIDIEELISTTGA